MRKLATPNGIAVRQAMDPSTGWFDSPDVIVTGSAAAVDPTQFVDPDGYNWFFARPPALGAANYLYVRGLNYYSSGKKSARVYIYYATSDQVLDPSKWQSSALTVNGTAQNYLDIQATSRFQYVSAGPMMWTPPTTTGATYYVIAWTDNSASPTPPVWPTTPFANLAALAAYVQANQAMAVVDTIYRGGFVRQAPGQTVLQPGAGAQTSPDLIVVGVNAAQDASSFSTQGSYSPGAVAAGATFDLRNFVYVRAINTVAGPNTSRVYLYWASTSALSPPSWQSTNFTFAGKRQNYVDLVATTQNQVVTSTVPIVWTPPSQQSPYTLVLAAYIDPTGGALGPPDFSSFGYLSSQAITALVGSQSQLAWVAIQGTTVTPPTMAMETPISLGSVGPQTMYVGVQFTKIPTDGSVSISIPGPDAANTVVVPKFAVPDPNAFVAWRVTYPASFATSAVVTYAQGGTPLPAGATITVQVVPAVGT